MKQQQTSANRRLSALAAAIGGSLLVACASSPLTDPQMPSVSSGDSPHAMSEELERSMSTHRAAEFAQAALLFGRVSLIEPLIRPFSTEKALISLVLKSSFGFAQRVTIDAVRFQTLEREAIPALVSRPGMDLAEWEADLAGIAGTPTTGTVKFLVDGEEFFRVCWKRSTKQKSRSTFAPTSLTTTTTA